MPTPHGRKLSDVLAWNVRRRREAAGLTQQDIADRMHALGHSTWTHQVTTSKVERRVRAVPVDELAGLALALEVAPVDLLTPDPDGPPLDLGLPSLLEGFARLSERAWFAGEQDLQVTWEGNRPTGAGASRRARTKPHSPQRKETNGT